jgi:uncharacterized membrane protein
VILANGLIRFLVAHHIISKEMVRTLIGLSLFVPMVIVPIAVVVILLFSLRKMPTRATSIINLMAASGVFLISIMAESGCHSALSMSPPRTHHPPITIREISMDLVALVWFAGAAGLFFRKRTAWIGSLLGVGASVCVLTALLAAAMGLCFFSSTEADSYSGGNQAGVGYIFAIVVTLIQVSIMLAICLWLLLGLIQMRKEVFAHS